MIYDHNNYIILFYWRLVWIAKNNSDRTNPLCMALFVSQWHHFEVFPSRSCKHRIGME